MTKNNIKDKVIVVTGAAGGFGRLICEMAAVQGAKIVGADLNASGLEDMVTAITDAGGTATGHTTDVTNLSQMQTLCAHAVKQHGSIDVMINNAGTMPLAFFADHTIASDAWSRCIDINIKGVLNGMIAVHDQMISQGRGHIINLSSIYGNAPVAGAGIYGATKAAVNVMSDSFRVESQGKIKVTIVKPTGVPATGLGAGVVNQGAIVGILGQNAPSYLGRIQAIGEGKGEPEELDSNDVRYAALAPEFIAEQILNAINQPWGVSIGDITIRATGDGYIL